MDKSREELRRIAIDNNCKGYAFLNKEQLIQLLVKCGVRFDSVDSTLSTHDICENLQRTYNTKILDLADESTREMFKIVSRECSELGKGNTTLMKLINNKYSYNKTVSNYISGPVSITVQYSKKDQKTFYIFGEYHDFSEECSKEKNALTITQYLKKLFDTTHAFIDMYIEIPPDGNMKGVNPGYLSELTEVFENCINVDKRRFDKKCSLLRLHPVDIRWKMKNKVMIGLFQMENVYLRLRKELPEENYGVFREVEVKEYITNIFLSNKEDALRYIMRNFRSSPFFKKEIERSTLELVIYNWVNELIKKELETDFDNCKYNSLYIYEALKKPEIPEDMLKYIKLFSQILINKMVSIHSSLMDGYTMARVFKKFNVKKSNQPEEPHNVIIYAGDEHCDNYRKLLSSLGYKYQGQYFADEVQNKYDEIPECLDMTDIKQPFFLL
jgi:hypothetical protein